MKNLLLLSIIIAILISGCVSDNEKNSEIDVQLSSSEQTTGTSNTTIEILSYSDDEILSLVLKYCGLNSTTVKLKSWPEANPDQEQLENPIFYVYLESKPDNTSNEMQTKEYYRVYFGQNYGDHTARYLTIFVKDDLSEIVLSEDIILDENDEVILTNQKDT